jgi:hypothetical protein
VARAPAASPAFSSSDESASVTSIQPGRSFDSFLKNVERERGGVVDRLGVRHERRDRLVGLAVFRAAVGGVDERVVVVLARAGDGVVDRDRLVVPLRPLVDAGGVVLRDVLGRERPEQLVHLGDRLVEPRLVEVRHRDPHAGVELAPREPPEVVEVALRPRHVPRLERQPPEREHQVGVVGDVVQQPLEDLRGLGEAGLDLVDPGERERRLQVRRVAFDRLLEVLRRLLERPLLEERPPHLEVAGGVVGEPRHHQLEDRLGLPLLLAAEQHAAELGVPLEPLRVGLDGALERPLRGLELAEDPEEQAELQVPLGARGVELDRRLGLRDRGLEVEEARLHVGDDEVEVRRERVVDDREAVVLEGAAEVPRLLADPPVEVVRVGLRADVRPLPGDGRRGLRLLRRPAGRDDAGERRAGEARHSGPSSLSGSSAIPWPSVVPAFLMNEA